MEKHWGTYSVRWLFRASGAILLLTMVGCSTPRTDFPRIINEPAPVAASVRHSFGRIGVLPIGVATNVVFHPPAGKTEAFERVTATTFDHTAGRIHTHNLEELGSAVVFASLMGVVSVTAGAVAAATVGVSDKEFQQCDAALRTALYEEPIPAGVHKALAHSLSRGGISNASVLPEGALTRIKWNGTTTDFSALASDGVDSVLDIRVAEAGFELRPGFNPNVSFAPLIAVYLIRVRDGEVLHAGYLEYRGSQRPFTKWAAGQAKPFRKEMRVAERKFAEAIYQQYFEPQAR